MYASETGVFLYATYIPSPTAKRACYWFDAVGTYLPQAKWSNGVYRCPGYKGEFYEGLGLDTGFRGALGSYAYNGFGTRLAEPHKGLGGFAYVVTGTITIPTVKESEVQAPSEMFAFGDSLMNNERLNGALGRGLDLFWIALGRDKLPTEHAAWATD